jgi:hypothetical protein
LLGLRSQGCTDEGDQHHNADFEYQRARFHEDPRHHLDASSYCLNIVSWPKWSP